ncbi:MAG: hypothetical protein NTV99_06795 [Deltaproteobacteria bacterium]|nr:hypothetical protein [Deltaproteobacteria bacterium]
MERLTMTEAIRERPRDGKTSSERRPQEGFERMKLVEKISLPNQLSAEVYDQSRPISQDTVKVVFIARVKVEVKEEYFDRREHYEMTRKMYGPEVLFEYMNVRAFVPVRDREKVFRDFEHHFKKDSLPYISKPQFPSRFVLSKYHDIRKNPWKYGLLPEQKVDAPGE